MLCFVCLFWSESSFAQWRPIFALEPYQFVQSVSQLPGDSNTFFIGTLSRAYGQGQLWKTYDRGKNWKKVFEFSGTGLTAITDIVFKNTLIGWFGWARGNPDCYRTTDGGETWLQLVNAKIGFGGGGSNSLYYNYSSKLLFSSTNNSQSMISYDLGDTWIGLGNPPSTALTGIAFIDTIHGIGVTATNIGLGFQPYYITSDGGFTWTQLKMKDTVSSYQPAVLHSKIYIVHDSGDYPADDRSTQSPGIYVIDSFGFEPRLIKYLPLGSSQCMISDSVNLYLQISSHSNNYDYFGIIKSTDEGKSWESLCGPSAPYYPTRFLVDNLGGIWAGEESGLRLYSFIWHNPTGKANSPRVQFEINNSSRQIHLYTGDVATISFYYPNEKYFEQVDSVSLTLNYSKALGCIKETPSVGWKVIRKEYLDTSVKIIVQHTDIADPLPGSKMLTVSFQTYISPEASSTVALDEVAFNQDVAQRPCMLDELKSTDSLHITFIDRCGDSVIRNFLKVGPSLSISSIYPNPAGEHVTLNLHSAAMQEAQIECVNALGAISFSQKIVLKSRDVSVPVDTKELASGLYVLRIRTASGSVSQSFLKE
jgi:hypothetical protein